MSRYLRHNGLTLALALLFLLSLIGHAAMGYRTELGELKDHGQPAVGLIAYLGSGAFLSSLFENWESEFLQMWVFVMLTAYLVQKGSPESRPVEGEADQDRDPALDARKPDAPWPVRAGGPLRALYSHSLGLALLILFLLSFGLHLVNSARLADDEAARHGDTVSGVLAHIGSAEFWFESFQNWQSEFLSTAVLIILAIFLRERGSPESKPVSAPMAVTGSE